MKQVSQNKYVNVDKIISANAYEKDGKFKVAIAMDTVNKEESIVYSDAFGTKQDAVNFITSLK